VKNGPVEFWILGPLEVEGEGGALGRVGSRQERLLAALLLDANRVVSAARLVQAIWDDAPPPTAARQVHNAVSALRKRLTCAGVRRPDQVLVTEGAGYLLRVEATELDWLVFEERVRVAQRLVGDGDPVADELMAHGGEYATTYRLQAARCA
jgi:DNA-binding SARP family transcriptional activator